MPHIDIINTNKKKIEQNEIFFHVNLQFAYVQTVRSVQELED